MKKSAEKYHSEVLDEVFAEITPEEQRKADYRMQLAAKIFDAMKSKNISKLELARKMGKQASVITKWLSGTHNFTADTLFEIGGILGIQLLNIVRDSGDNQYIAVKKIENDGSQNQP